MPSTSFAGEEPATRSSLSPISRTRWPLTSSSSSIPTIRRADSRRHGSYMPAGPRCWSSTKPSSTFFPPRPALPADCRATPSSCDPSARPMAWPACAWALRSPKRPSPAAFATNWGRGPCRGQRSRSAGGRWVTMLGCRQRRLGLRSNSRRLDAMLIASGFTILGGTSLFRLASHPTARRLIDALGRQGIHVRTFADQPTRLRFGVPADEESFRRLSAALQVPQKV